MQVIDNQQEKGGKFITNYNKKENNIICGQSYTIKEYKQLEEIMKKNWILAFCFSATLGIPTLSVSAIPIQMSIDVQKKNWKEVCLQTMKVIKTYMAESSFYKDIDTSGLSMKTNLKTTYGFDSLDIVELLMKCESAFGITIEDSNLEKYDLYQVEGLVHAIYFQGSHQKVRDVFDNKSWKKQDTCGDTDK